jgi:hypothetical protein
VLDVEWPSLVAKWEGEALSEPFTLIRTTMPENAPGTLSREEYVAIFAYILRLAGAPSGPSALSSNADGLAEILIVPGNP